MKSEGEKKGRPPSLPGRRFKKAVIDKFYLVHSWKFSEAEVVCCIKKLFLEISQNSQENSTPKNVLTFVVLFVTPRDASAAGRPGDVLRRSI